MHQRFFGEARDIAKRQIMEWLAPNVRWAAHPMWYGNREAEPQVPDFLNRYATAIGVDIVDGGDSANPHALLEAASACREHLFLDPDTGLGERTPKPKPRWNTQKSGINLWRNWARVCSSWGGR